VIFPLINVVMTSVMEIVGAPRRMFTGMMIQVFFAVGVCYVALVSFLLKSWQYINLAVVIPTVFYLSYWWYVLTVLCVWVYSFS